MWFGGGRGESESTSNFDKFYAISTYIHCTCVVELYLIEHMDGGQYTQGGLFQVREAIQEQLKEISW